MSRAAATGGCGLSLCIVAYKPHPLTGQLTERLQCDTKVHNSTQGGITSKGEVSIVPSSACISNNKLSIESIRCGLCENI